jgi:hypothetical protein
MSEEDVPLALAGQHIAVVIPAYDGKVPVELIQSLFGLSALLTANGARMSFMSKSGCAIVQGARNALLAEIMKYPDITGVLHIDGDIVFKPMDGLRLIAHCDDNYEIMAGLYRAKTDKHYLYFASWENDETGHPAIKENGVLNCTRVPFGFCYVKAQVLQTLWEQAPILTEDGGNDVRLVFDCPYDPVAKKMVGEDYTFCDKAIAAGYRIGVLADVDLKHIGPKEYRGTFKSVFDRFRAGEMEVSHGHYAEL